jgi:hypothetical protein
MGPKSVLARSVAGLLLACVAGACSGGGTKRSGPTKKREPTESTGTCRLLTKDEVQSGLHISVEGEGKASDTGAATNCDWSSGGRFVRLAVTRAKSPDDAAKTFDVLSQQPGADQVATLGDRAVYLAGPAGDTANSQLFVLKGTDMVALTYCCATREQLVDLSRKALGRLP